jgi:hypothetical protein
MEHDRIAALIAAYLDGRAELEPTVAALVEAWREEGWGLYLDPEQAAPAQRERARRLWVEYGRRWRRSSRTARGRRAVPPSGALSPTERGEHPVAPRPAASHNRARRPARLALGS